MFTVTVHVLVSLMLVQKGSEASEIGVYNNLVSLLPGTQKERSLRKQFTTVVRKGMMTEKDVRI